MSSFSSLASLHNMRSSTQLRTNTTSKTWTNKSNNLIVDKIKVTPLANIADELSLNVHMKQYLNVKNIKLSEFDTYSWPIIMGGKLKMN